MSIDYKGHSPINRFRRKRGELLRRRIDRLAEHLGRDVVILDLGGTPQYWLNLGLERIARIELVNSDRNAFGQPLPDGLPEGLFTFQVGDARRLTDWADGAADLVHSNSVIEHVGRWRDMAAMASEMRRVGRAGWMQTPAWSFPLEPHFHTPFMHWFGAPLRARMLSLSASRRLREMGIARRRHVVDGVNLLGRTEVETLFPGCAIQTERVMLLAKSYMVEWGFETATADSGAPAAVSLAS
jgi:Methyltransferase domain